MKSKKAVSPIGSVAKIILILLVLGIFAYVILFPVQNLIVGESNQQAVETWVLQSGMKEKVTVGLADSGRPPVPYLQETKEFENLEDMQKNAIPQIADSIYDCEKAFNFGKTDFMENKGLDKVFCFQCASFKFSDKLKSKKYKLAGLTNYLETKSPIPDAGSYTELLNEKSEGKYAIITDGNKKDELSINEDIYVYAIATKEMKDKNIKSASLSTTGTGLGVITAIALGSNPVGWTIAGVGAVVTAYNFIFAEKEFRFTTYVGSPTTINKICSS